MRISKNNSSKSKIELEKYDAELQEKVDIIFNKLYQEPNDQREIYEQCISLLTKIKEATIKLPSLFWTNQQLSELNDSMDFFQTRILNMISMTKYHLRSYEEEKWRLFLDNKD